MMICHYDETNTSGGLDKQARLLSRTLRFAGQDVVILASTRAWSKAGWTSDDIVPIRFFWTYASPQVSGRYLPAALIWAFQLFVWIAFNRAKITLLHGHQIRIHAFASALAQKFWGIPSILKSGTGGTGADIRAIGTRKYFGAAGRRFIIRNTSTFVATTKSIEEDLLEYSVPQAKIAVIPNGLKVDVAKQELSAELRSKRALFLGRLAPDKNAPALGEAAGQVASHLGLTIDFYGRGRELPKLEAALGKSSNPAATYRGFVEDTSAVLSQYGYLLLASSGEGLSNAMIEAMTQGVVPVTTRVSGCVDHITPGVTGFFFDGLDQDSLRRGLKMLETIPAAEWKVMSDNVKTYARSRFDMKNVAQAYVELYAALSSGRQT